MFDGNQISLAAAKKIAKVCRDFAAAKGGSMSLYILDNAGEFVHMERMDGQVFNNIRTALMKAETSLKTEMPTSVYTAQGRNNPAGQNRTIAQYDFFTNSGGLPDRCRRPDDRRRSASAAAPAVAVTRIARSKG